MNLINQILGQTTQDKPIVEATKPRSKEDKQILSYRKYKERQAKKKAKSEASPTKLLLGRKSKKTKPKVLPQGLKALNRNAKNDTPGEASATKVSPTI
jgi:hypothetical protein